MSKYAEWALGRGRDAAREIFAHKALPGANQVSLTEEELVTILAVAIDEVLQQQDEAFQEMQKERRQ